MTYNADTDTFEYTEAFTPDSSFVRGAFYDLATAQLLVRLNDGVEYLYSDVDHKTFADFRASSSAGYFYNTRIKKDFGPGEYFGYDTDTMLKPAQFVSTNTYTVQTSAPSTLISLATPAVSRKYSVRFTVEDGNSVKSHTVEASGFDDAASKTAAALAALGLNFEVKGVDVV